MELQQLKYFKTVATMGKISDAAEALFISAPALSTSISRLEKELGVALFDRTNNRIALNPQGQIFLKYTNQIFATIDSCAGHKVYSIFDPNDLGDYASFASHECPLCKKGEKIEALVNSFGYSKLG